MTQDFITSEQLTEQLSELAHLGEVYEKAKQNCVGSNQPVSDSEFEAWADRSGFSPADSSNASLEYRQYLDAHSALIEKRNYIEHLPLLASTEAVTELANMFPSLRGAPGIDPFDEETVADWLRSDLEPQTRHAGKLLLSVWENEPAFFNLTEAFAVWDEAHRQAYIDWFHRPLMPQRTLWGELYLT